MTTKTQIAIFAIAAFAIAGFSFGPVYAYVVASESHTFSSGSYNYGDRDEITCGSNDKCSVELGGWEGSNTVRVDYGVSGNTSCDEVRLYITGNGWNEEQVYWNMDYEAYTVINGPNDNDDGDRLIYTAQYIGCS